MLVLRRATADDFLAFFGRPPPTEIWFAVAACRGDELVAIGSVFWFWNARSASNHVLQAWAYIDEKEPMPAVVKHRIALRALAILRAEGETAIYSCCNSSIDGAERWLRRLGFLPAPEWAIGNEMVWRCDLSN